MSAVQILAIVSLSAFGVSVVVALHEPSSNRPWRASSTLGLVFLASFLALAIKVLA